MRDKTSSDRGQRVSFTVDSGCPFPLKAAALLTRVFLLRVCFLEAVFSL